jgi:hypothetical protein
LTLSECREQEVEEKEKREGEAARRGRGRECSALVAGRRGGRAKIEKAKLDFGTATVSERRMRPRLGRYNMDNSPRMSLCELHDD